MNRIKSLGARLAIVPCLAMAPAAMAQEQDATEVEVEAVIVTARQRAESLIDVPLSVAVYSEQILSDMGASSLRSLENRTPNVVLDSGDSESTQRVAVRGISSEARTVGQETGFGVYVDGVYTGRAETYNQQLPDVASVEILRGPQGTVFGRNTIAGAMSVTTRKPGSALEGTVSLEAANYDTQRAAGYVSGPIIDGLLFGKVAGSWGRSGGYGVNTWNNTKVGSYDFVQGRLQLRATPTDRLELILSADYYRRGYRPYDGEYIYSDIGVGVAPGDYTVVQNEAVRDKEQTRYNGVSLYAEYEFGGGQRLVSISAYRESSWGPGYLDNARIGPDLFYTLYSNDSVYRSQELRLISPKGDRFDYVIGAYLSSQESDAVTPFVIGQDFEAFTGLPLNGAVFLTTPAIDTRTSAVFAHGNYRLAERWTLSAGVRYTREKKDAYFFQQGIPPFIPTLGPFTDQASESVWTPTVALEYQLGRYARLYGQVSRGYKPGGFNADNISSTDNFSFGPETVTNYEFGYKAELFGRRARINAAVFLMDYSDLQVTQFDVASSSNFIDNAASATVKGLELEVAATPMEGLEISGALGLLNARYDQFVDAFGQDLSGNDLIYAPKLTAATAVQYTRPLVGDLELVLRGEANHRGAMEGDVENAATSRLPSYTLFNARAGLQTDRFSLTLWANNLADERLVLFRATRPKLLLGYTETFVQYAPPRSFGITAKFDF